MSVLFFLFAVDPTAHAAPPVLDAPVEAPHHRKPKRPGKPTPTVRPAPRPTPTVQPPSIPRGTSPSARPAVPDYRSAPTVTPPAPRTSPQPSPAPTRPAGEVRPPVSSPRDPSSSHDPSIAASARPEGLPDVRRPEIRKTPTAEVREKVAPRPELGTTRAYDRSARPAPPPRADRDPRYARPSPRSVARYPSAPAGPPRVYTYRPWYGHWYVHPYYRYTHATWVVVSFPFAVYAWDPVWMPPSRPGWVWVPGYWAFGWWHPGYWRPTRHVVVVVDTGYVYVPGWWYGDVYVDGYYRVDGRPGWMWVDGAYVDDGVYVSGHWRPSGPGPDGYVWESGFFDGRTWVEGFWRPVALDGFVWRQRHYDADGLLQCGYWEPVDPNPGFVWVPGWFDGNTWQRGEWVAEAEYRSADIDGWKPEESFDEAWDAAPAPLDADELPLAIAVDEVGE